MSATRVPRRRQYVLLCRPSVVLMLNGGPLSPFLSILLRHPQEELPLLMAHSGRNAEW
jgi:hypothetical protein